MRKTALGARPGQRSRPVATYGCKATGCQTLVNHPLLMCVEHWRLVPAAVQRQVWAAWRRIGREPDAREAHAKAVQAAIDAVHSKQLARKAKRDASTPDLF
jgi:hypothetical protein